jgi:hypothetical protein
MTKTARVVCNDPNRPQFYLTVSGNVEKFVTIEPTAARLFGKRGEAIRATIRILPEEKYPFRIEGPTRQQTRNIAYSLSELTEPGARGYLLTVVNRRSQKGRYFEKIVLKTDSPLYPEIKIPVHGYVTE